MHVDRTPPSAPDGLQLAVYNADQHQATVSWNVRHDADAPDCTASTGVAGYSYRYRLDAGAWSAWTANSDPQTSDLSAAPHQQLEVQAEALDAAGTQARPPT